MYRNQKLTIIYSDKIQWLINRLNMHIEHRMKRYKIDSMARAGSVSDGHNHKMFINEFNADPVVIQCRNEITRLKSIATPISYKIEEVNNES